MLRRGFLVGIRRIAGGGVVGDVDMGMALLSSLMTGIWPTEASEALDPARV